MYKRQVVACAVAARAFGFGFAAAFLLAGAFAFVAGAFGFAPDPLRSPPIRDARVARRLPRTLGSDDALAAFFVFFFAVFSAMRKKVARARVVTGYSDAATRSVTAPVRKK